MEFRVLSRWKRERKEGNKREETKEREMGEGREQKGKEINKWKIVYISISLLCWELVAPCPTTATFTRQTGL